MKVVIHQTTLTMTGEGVEVLAPRGVWLAAFSEGNLIHKSSSLNDNGAAQGCADTVIVSEDVA